jgi:hypothetical protein
MNEMTLLEDLCATVPAPDAARLDAIRAQVLAEAVHGEAAAGARPGRIARRAAARPRRQGAAKLRLALAAGGAAALTVALVLAGGIPFRGGPLAPPASAAALLNRAAAAALAEPVPSQRQFIYTVQEIYSSTGRGGFVLHRQRQWQLRDNRKAVYWDSQCNLLAKVPDPCWTQVGGGRTYDGLVRLPLPTERLLAYLAGLPSTFRNTDDREWAGAFGIADESPVMPPRFGAAFFRAVARIPGITLLPRASDAAGAHGIGITRAARRTRDEMIFDPRTYRLIGLQLAVAVHGRSAVSVTWATDLLEARFVSHGPRPHPWPKRSHR